MQAAPISFTDIHYFARIKEVDDFNDFLYLIRRLDYKYLEKSKNDSASSDNKSN